MVMAASSSTGRILLQGQTDDDRSSESIGQRTVAPHTTTIAMEKQ